MRDTPTVAEYDTHHEQGHFVGSKAQVESLRAKGYAVTTKPAPGYFIPMEFRRRNGRIEVDTLVLIGWSRTTKRLRPGSIECGEYR